MFPYMKGYMQYRPESALLDEGVTYFYRFEMTKEGLVCTASWAEGEESDYIGFPLVVDETQKDCQYFGVWFGGDQNTKMNGRLTRVRCYDEKGTDLGVSSGYSGSSATVYDSQQRQALNPNTKIRHSYSLTLDGAANVVISNAKFSRARWIWQRGLILTAKSR